MGDAALGRRWRVPGPRRARSWSTRARPHLPAPALVRAQHGHLDAAGRWHPPQLSHTQGRSRQADRKRDTRRKILAGAMVLDRVERGEVAEERFKAAMGRFLERALFDLPPCSASEEKTG